ncbi:MAG: dihydrofolate reductase [Clostridiales bacterium]|jgi:dihydrofolate reductase|nr:dihydrofolate reductase [Clostridiales bacterium]
MKAIVVVDKNWGIGKDGKLLVHLPGDLKYFKEKTLGKVVVMGRTTLESLPGGEPLKDRINIVLSRKLCDQDGCTLLSSIDSLFEELENYDLDDVFVIGGESIYRELLDHCGTLYVTKICEEFEADKFFPNLDESDEWELVFESEPCTEKGITYKFTEYRRVCGGVLN